MTTPSAVLFDIDGTLITTGGAGGRSWAAAFQRIYGRDADITKFSETGMTDPMVGRSVFRGVMGRDPSQEELAQLIMGYLMELPNAVEESPGYRRLPGVIRTLEHLASNGMLLGLVTGNIEGAARIKIDRAHLNPYFAFGGYGSDSDDRAELTRAAIARASTMHGTELDPATVFVVGDTPRDVAAAHAVGAVSVTVATGEYSVERLAGAGAEHVLPTLESPFPTEI